MPAASHRWASLFLPVTTRADPNYFYWFDCAFRRLLRSRGLSQRELKKRFGAVTPIVQAHCDFKAPARYDSEFVMEVDVQPEGDRRFRVSYHLAVDGKVIGIGHEVRAWATVDAKGDLTGTPINLAFLDLIRSECAR
jgi:4-hydroxybenzoyl-CoA thioesterase